MVILSWVSPTVTPFDTSLDTLKRFLTDWGTYRTSVRLTIYLPWILMFNEPFRFHFIFWPFHTVTLISHFSIYVMSLLLYVICDDAPLSPNHSYWSSSLSYYWKFPQNVSSKNILLMSSPLSFPFFAQQPADLCHPFSKLLHYLLKRRFLLLLIFLLLFTSLLFTHQYDNMWPHFPHLIHLPLENLPFLLFHLLSPAFNARTFPSNSIFSCVLFLFISIFQKQYISFFRSWWINMLTLKDTLVVL